MTGIYRVMLEGTDVGTATIEQRGLYYRIVCNCTFTVKGIYTISIQNAEQSEYLGVCIPEGEYYRLVKTVPIKRFIKGNLRFFVTKKDETNEFRFIPIESGAQFGYLSKLMHAELKQIDSKIGVIIHSETLIQQ